MGQNRSDTSVQRAAKQRRSDRDRCPKCKRGAALRRGSDSWDAENGDRVIVTVVECRWRDGGKCDYSETTERRVAL